MSELTKTIKELTGEDAVDIFGADAENIVEGLHEKTNMTYEPIENQISRPEKSAFNVEDEDE